MKNRIYHFIYVNGEKIYIDFNKLLDGELRLDDTTGSLSEQCRGCGTDILESGEPLGSLGTKVMCTTCGAQYLVQEERT